MATEGLLANGSKYCIACRFQIPTNAKFCSQCGQNQDEQIPNPSAPPMVARPAYGGEGAINNNPNNANKVIVVAHQVPVLPAGVHTCQASNCVINTTMRCNNCSKWTCQGHLTTVRGACYTYPMICPDCYQARCSRRAGFYVVFFIIMVVIMIVAGSST